MPQSGFAGSAEDLAAVAARLNFPVIVKPTWWRHRGNLKFKTARFETREELLAAGDEMISGGAALAVQEFVPGGDDAVEVYMFYRSRDGETVWGCTGRKLLQTPAGAGVMAIGEALWLPEVAELSEAFLKGIDYRGLGGIEYKCSGGRHYFIEVSTRQEGFQPLAHKEGVDLAWYAYADMAFGAVSAARVGQKHAYWMDGIICLGNFVRRENRIVTIRKFLGLFWKRETQFAIWWWRDPWPWFAVLGDLAKRLLRRIFRRKV